MTLDDNDVNVGEENTATNRRVVLPQNRNKILMVASDEKPDYDEYEPKDTFQRDS